MVRESTERMPGPSDFIKTLFEIPCPKEIDHRKILHNTVEANNGGHVDQQLQVGFDIFLPQGKIYDKRQTEPPELSQVEKTFG